MGFLCKYEIVLAVLKFGGKSWKPWIISILVEAGSWFLIHKKESELTNIEKDEFKRRRFLFLYYLLRSPFLHLITRFFSFLFLLFFFFVSLLFFVFFFLFLRMGKVLDLNKLTSKYNETGKWARILQALLTKCQYSIFCHVSLSIFFFFFFLSFSFFLSSSFFFSHLTIKKKKKRVICRMYILNLTSFRMTLDNPLPDISKKEMFDMSSLMGSGGMIFKQSEPKMKKWKNEKMKKRSEV